MRSCLGRLVSWSLSLLAAVLGLAALAWVVGRIFTDRWLWSQWLFWIPTPTMLPAVLLSLLLAFRPSANQGRRKARIRIWAAAMALISMYFIVIEHRFMHAVPTRPAGNALQITHWNMGPATWRDQKPFFEALKPLMGDITIVTNPGGTHTEREAQQWLIGHGFETITFGPFAVMSRVPCTSVRLLVGSNPLWVYVLEFDAGKTLGRAINVYVVDLPSNTHESRWAIARQIRSMLDELHSKNGAGLPEADLVVGDFNIPRGSASLDLMFPGLREAYDDAGHGYGASFHRAFPLYHIDHMRLGTGVRALRYDLIDPGLGRHDAQSVWLAANP